MYHDLLKYLDIDEEFINQDVSGEAVARAPEAKASVPAYDGTPGTKLRPRERLLRDGREALSDRELLAIILNTGVRGKNVMALAGELLDTLLAGNNIPSAQELSGVTGLGSAKTCAILAMLEFGRRRWGGRGTRIRYPSDVYDFLKHYAAFPQERFITISLNGAHEVLGSRIVTIGLVNKTIIHPREVFADIIKDRASAFCIAHNHPSGSLTPSEEDDEITFRLKKAAKILGIQLIDHVIFTERGYYSYSQSDRLK